MKRPSSRRPRRSAIAAAAGFVLLHLAGALPAAARTAAIDDAAAGAGARVVNLEAAADGGFWAVLDNGPVLDLALLVHFSAAGQVVGERWLRAGGGLLQASELAVDDAGRAWVPVWRSVETADGAHEDHLLLRIYDVDGSVAAEAPLDGQFLGLSGGDALVLDEWGEPPRVLRLDPFRRRQRIGLELRREEFGPPNEGCIGVPRAVVPAADGAVYFLDIGSPRILVRRYEPPGVPSGDQDAARSEGLWLSAASHGDELYLALPGEVVRLSPHAPRLSWPTAEPVADLAPGADGAWALLEDGSRVVRLHGDGSSSPPLALDPPPRGIGYGQRRDLLAAAGEGSGAEVASSEQLVQVLLLAGGDRAAAAHRTLLDLGVEAADALVAAGRRWGWSAPLERLAVDLLERDPVGVGDRMTAQVEQDLTGGTLDPEQRLPSLLVMHWPWPSPRFLLLLEEHVLLDGSELSWLAYGAYSGDLEPWLSGTPDPGPPGERFPAPLWLVERHLQDLELEEPQLYAWPDFLAAQFHVAADAVEARLRDPADPGRPWLLDLLARLPIPLVDAEPGHFGAAEAELARRSRRWADDTRPEIAAVGTLLAVATGDAGRTSDLLALAAADESLRRPAGQALAALLRRLPPEGAPTAAEDLARQLMTAPGELAAAGLPSFVRSAPPAALGAAVLAMAHPDVPSGNRSALVRLLLAEDVWPRVPDVALAGLVVAGHPAPAASREEDYRFLDAMWRRLVGRPELRGKLEDRFAEAVRAQPLRPAGGLPPAWLAVLATTPASGLARRVPASLLRELVAEPAPAATAERWVRVTAAAAAARGPWPGFAAWLERELIRRPGLGTVLPAGAAEGWLGRERVKELLVDGETTWSRGASPQG